MAGIYTSPSPSPYPVENVGDSPYLVENVRDSLYSYPYPMADLDQNFWRGQNNIIFWSLN